MAIVLQGTCRLDRRLKSNVKYVFANSLLGTTIQDSGIREKSIKYRY